MRLCILAIFKNERHIINEWVDHHISVGFDHIYLMDNMSTDNYEIDPALAPYVTIKKYPKGQKTLYRECLPLVKTNADWIAVIDLDEFIYSKEGSVRQAITQLPPSVTRVDVQMKNFGISSFKDPKSKILSQAYYRPDSAKHPKCISRTRGLTQINVHTSRHTPKNNRVYYPHTSTKLCINHYRYQSVEYLYGIKEQRGGGVNKQKYAQHAVLAHAKRTPSFIEDKWLCDNSNAVIARCHARNGPGPATEIYPSSSWTKQLPFIKEPEAEYCEVEGHLAEKNVPPEQEVART